MPQEYRIVRKIMDDFCMRPENRDIVSGQSCTYVKELRCKNPDMSQEEFDVQSPAFAEEFLQERGDHLFKKGSGPFCWPQDRESIGMLQAELFRTQNNYQIRRSGKKQQISEDEDDLEDLRSSVRNDPEKNFINRDSRSRRAGNLYEPTRLVRSTRTGKVTESPSHSTRATVFFPPTSELGASTDRNIPGFDTGKERIMFKNTYYNVSGDHSLKLFRTLLRSVIELESDALEARKQGYTIDILDRLSDAILTTESKMQAWNR